MKISIALFALAASFSIISCADNKLHNETEQASMAGGSGEESFKVDITDENVSQGHTLYLSSCSACHGTTGQGNGPASTAQATKPRDHTNGAYMDKLSNRHLYNVIKMGGGMYGFPAMPAQPQLKDQEIAQLIAFMRTLSSTYKKQ
jgi:high-affinity iron transporter